MVLQLDMVQSIALAVVLLLLGEYLVKKVSFLSKYLIPAPVVGGLLFAILALFLRMGNIMEFEFDGTLRVFMMTAFFTTVGFGASFGLLKKGGKNVLLFLALATGLVVIQNVIGVTLASVFNLNPLLGLVTGSVPLTGGHGTSAAFGPIIEEAGFAGAETIAVAAATFGLVAGGMIGGPTGKRLISKYNLSGDAIEKSDTGEKKEKSLLVPQNFYVAWFELLLAMGLGTIVSSWIQALGLTFPGYIGAMLVGAVIRNISDVTKAYPVPKEEMDIVGGVALSLFLGMALMSLRLWELAELAVPMIVILAAQILAMYLFANFVTFNVMGRDYDAAVLASGHCGFAMGATPNGIANMNAIAVGYGHAPTAFFVLPLVGALFIDFFNSFVITMFMNFL